MRARGGENDRLTVIPPGRSW